MRRGVSGAMAAAAAGAGAEVRVEAAAATLADAPAEPTRLASKGDEGRLGGGGELLT